MISPSNSYYYRSGDLIEILMNIGFSKTKRSTYQKLFRLKWNDKFKPPVDPNTGRWVFTKKQLLDIARSLSPGGSGEWKFNNQL